METIIHHITDVQKDMDKILEAAEVINNGGIVAFPTETVYGLGAAVRNEEAIKKIFEVKGRPQDNPLIVHLGRAMDFHQAVRPDSLFMSKLMESFWPGPLTMILPRIIDLVPSIVTAGLPNVAIRMPDSEIACALINACNMPIVAPSANLSGKPSPTKAEHVIADFDGKIDMILAGPDCKVGIESTVIDLCTDPPCIVRPGHITKEQIEEVLPRHVLLDPHCYPPLEE